MKDKMIYRMKDRMKDKMQDRTNIFKMKNKMGSERSFQNSSYD